MSKEELQEKIDELTTESRKGGISRGFSVGLIVVFLSGLFLIDIIGNKIEETERVKLAKVVKVFERFISADTSNFYSIAYGKDNVCIGYETKVGFGDSDTITKENK